MSDRELFVVFVANFLLLRHCRISHTPLHLLPPLSSAGGFHLLCLCLRFIILSLHLLPPLPPPALSTPSISHPPPTPSPLIASTCSVCASNFLCFPYTFSLHCLHLLCLRLRFIIHTLPGQDGRIDVWTKINHCVPQYISYVMVSYLDLLKNI